MRHNRIRFVISRPQSRVTKPGKSASKLCYRVAPLELVQEVLDAIARSIEVSVMAEGGGARAGEGDDRPGAGAGPMWSPLRPLSVCVPPGRRPSITSLRPPIRQILAYLWYYEALCLQYC